MSLVEAKPEINVVWPVTMRSAAMVCEYAGRTCYRSIDKIGPGTAEPFLRARIKDGHTSVLGHASVTVEVVCSRSCSHQIVRHRLASYAQQSQRYVKQRPWLYVDPWTEVRPHGHAGWMHTVEAAFKQYDWMLRSGQKPEDARSVLPSCAATRLVWTQNLAQWRHVLRLRTDKRAQAEFRGLMLDLLAWFRVEAPWLVFDL